jgi:hypothetical protein
MSFGEKVSVAARTISVALVCLLGACRPGPETLESVLRRHTKAMGGGAAIESIHSIQIQLHIKDPDFEVDGNYRAARPGRMRIDIMAGSKHVYTEAFDGTRGWQWKGKGPIIDEKPEATAALRHGVELPGKLFGVHEIRGRGHQLSLLPRESIADVRYYPLRVVLSDGYTTTLYVDPADWLITRRRDFRPLHVDVDPRPTTIETEFSDFREVGGTRFPFASVDKDLQTGSVLETVRVKPVVLNPAVEDSIFDRL